MDVANIDEGNRTLDNDVPVCDVNVLNLDEVGRIYSNHAANLESHFPLRDWKRIS